MRAHRRQSSGIRRIERRLERVHARLAADHAPSAMKTRTHSIPKVMPGCR
jgi:hypothetical protein